MNLYGDIHRLIVDEYGEMEVEHPDSCSYHDDPVCGRTYECGVAHEISDAGLDEYFRCHLADEDYDDDSEWFRGEWLEPGSYKLMAWQDSSYSWYYGVTEYDGGVMLV